MAATKNSLEEYLEEIKITTEQDYSAASPMTYSIGPGGTSDLSYGAVPNVTIGTGFNTSSNGIWVNPTPTPVWTTTTTNTTNPYTVMGAGSSIQPGAKIHIQGEDADLVINKKSMRDWMEKVEERLNILTPNPEMEKEWDDLRKLGERYRKLEKKCKEKSDMWNKLKAMPKPETK